MSNTLITHDHLFQIVKKLSEDYQPYGQQKRSGDEDEGEEPVKSVSGYHGDCSSGCRFYAPLESPHNYDWGVCTNLKSHRCGLLTFEHQGCLSFEPDPRSLAEIYPDIYGEDEEG